MDRHLGLASAVMYCDCCFVKGAEAEGNILDLPVGLSLTYSHELCVLTKYQNVFKEYCKIGIINSEKQLQKNMERERMVGVGDWSKWNNYKH